MNTKSYSLKDTKPSNYLSFLITITSETGVGSSSTIQSIKKELEDRKETVIRYVSGGGIMRAFARSKGMTIEQFAEHNLLYPEEGWDKKCDEAIAAYGRQNHTVIEGRLPHVFAPHGFHVLLECDAHIRAQRRHGHPDYAAMTLQDVEHIILKRDADDRDRYDELYPGSLWLPGHYDLMLSTSIYQSVNIAKLILEGHAHWLSQLPAEKVISEVSI